MLIYWKNIPCPTCGDKSNASYIDKLKQNVGKDKFGRPYNMVSTCQSCGRSGRWVYKDLKSLESCVIIDNLKIERFILSLC